MNLWVNPDIERRKLSGNFPKIFTINKCLITFPKEKLPIVQFNDEIHWIATIEKAPGTSFEKGQPIHIYEVKSVRSVQLPAVNGKPVAFIYFRRSVRDSFQIFFDMSPNLPEKFAEKMSATDDSVGAEIAKSIQTELIEESIRIQESFQTQLNKIGLWTVPALQPYPLSKIVLQLEKNDTIGAKVSLTSYCTPQFLEELSSRWWTVKEIVTRKTLIIAAINAHREGKYVLSIPALLPQIEGIVTDWMYTKIPEELIPWRIESKTKKFHDIALNKPTPFAYECIVNSTVNFILGGPGLKTFKNWVKNIEQAFPNRHEVEHGKYDELLFTEENSIKLMLLIDTIYFIISEKSE